MPTEEITFQQKMKDLKEQVKKREKKMANTVRINRELNSKIIDRFVAMKHCPLLTNKNFICGNLKGHSLKKGEEEYCHCPKFINCPAFNQYMNHELIRNRRGIITNIEKNENDQ